MSVPIPAVRKLAAEKKLFTLNMAPGLIAGAMVDSVNSVTPVSVGTISSSTLPTISNITVDDDGERVQFSAAGGTAGESYRLAVAFSSGEERLVAQVLLRVS